MQKCVQEKVCKWETAQGNGGLVRRLEFDDGGTEKNRKKATKLDKKGQGQEESQMLADVSA